MNYMNRGGYGRRSRDSRGRYSRRGVPGSGRGRYRGEYEPDEMMDEMHRAHKEYMMGKNEYRRGNYGAKDDTLESLECMLEACVDMFEALKKNADNEEEVMLIQEYAEKISEM